MKLGTVCFFVKDNKVMLFRIHYPDNVERWNGVGGVVEEGETPEQAVVREVKEEIGVNERDLKRLHEFEAQGYHLIVFTLKDWEGEPKLLDSTLKEVKWFGFDEVPYEQMWVGNDQWLPNVLSQA